MGLTARRVPHRHLSVEPLTQLLHLRPGHLQQSQKEPLNTFYLWREDRIGRAAQQCCTDSHFVMNWPCTSLGLA